MRPPSSLGGYSLLPSLSSVSGRSADLLLSSDIMAGPPHTVPTSPYHKFQGPSPSVRYYRDELTPSFTDDHGDVFYETPHRELLIRIIKLGDAATLRRYLAANPDPASVLHAGHYLDDPFGNAADYGSKDCLALLLECWQSVGKTTQQIR